MENGKPKKKWRDPRRGNCSFCNREYERIERHMETCKLRHLSSSGKDSGKCVLCPYRDYAGDGDDANGDGDEGDDCDNGEDADCGNNGDDGLLLVFILFDLILVLVWFEIFSCKRSGP